MGSFGAGKSSFINTAITALTGEYKFYADVGSGSKHNTTRIHRYATYEMRWTTEKTLRGAIWFKKNEFLGYKLCDNNELRYEM